MREDKVIFAHSYGEESYGIVKLTQTFLFRVYSIPLHGGEECYEDTFDNYRDAVNYTLSFT
jgi:hypothetical protein